MILWARSARILNPNETNPDYLGKGRAELLLSRHQPLKALPGFPDVRQPCDDFLEVLHR